MEMVGFDGLANSSIFLCINEEDCVSYLLKRISSSLESKGFSVCMVWVWCRGTLKSVMQSVKPS